MEALGGWLRQVVAAVLLAALIDLLLPNRTMQRYVRLVAGLFILLTLAGPLLSWIKGDMEAKLTAGIEWAEREPAGGDDGSQLEAILAEAKRIGAGRDEQAAKLAVAGLEAGIKTVVEQEEGVVVEAVEVTATPAADGALTVERVKVRLADSNTVIAAESDEPIAEVDPVSPVVVDIDIGADTDKGEGGDRAVPAAAQNAAGQADDGREGRIAALVAGRFGIGTSKVDVYGASGG
ncbi:stage III sporulation protein AF [Cohnella rhizosphaerae]|uniref:Stage III sporulation protein AF n=1 Tax=Cohnella rhizosphaerae TaxID=1457232 RepID=A0A9X4QX92_9BACL|nr:stage III sporulation protein AF [Cohnella rhizosphaerae]MDG0813207.1 stage III sporulation protein AF [Cohnella rhizosphaerae]